MERAKMQKSAVLFNRYFHLKGIRFQNDTPSLRELYKQFIAIAWPATVEGALLSVISSADTMMVGTLGSAAIAAVGLTSQPRMILLVLAQSLCVATTALVARRRGEDDQAAANAVLKQSMFVVTILGVIMSLAGYFGAEPFMKLAGANDDTLQMSVDYFRIISSGLVLNCWLLCICAAMRAIGKTRVTMVTNITANLVNIVLNYLLIGGNFGFPKLGVKGAAIATVIGTGVACGIGFFFVAKKEGYLRLRVFEKLRFDSQTMRGLCYVGSSSMAESVFLRIGFLITTKMIADIGTAAFAAYQITSQVTSLSFTLGDGIASAGAALVGRSLGAKRMDLAMANVMISRKLAVIISIALMIALLFLRNLIPTLFTNEEGIISGVSLSLLVVLVGVLPQNGRVVYSGCLRGAGDARYVAGCSLLSVTILRPLFTYFFCYPMNAIYPDLQFAVTGPWLAFVLDAFIRDFLYSGRIRKEKWMYIRI
jgi:putative MATE family efflux protein